MTDMKKDNSQILCEAQSSLLSGLLSWLHQLLQSPLGLPDMSLTARSLSLTQSQCVDKELLCEVTSTIRLCPLYEKMAAQSKINCRNGSRLP